jgi:hypothetical protein
MFAVPLGGSLHFSLRSIHIGMENIQEGKKVEFKEEDGRP